MSGTPTGARAGAACSLTVASAVFAADAQSQVLPASSTFGTLAQVVFGLAVVMGAIALTAWLARRYMPAVRGVGGLVKVVGGVMVGPKERVVVVEVGDTWLVLGVTAQQVNTLHSLPRPAGTVADASARSSESEFSSWLGRALNKQRP
jgi:flagellar protein FliO/FliZ